MHIFPRVLQLASQRCSACLWQTLYLMKMYIQIQNESGVKQRAGYYINAADGALFVPEHQVLLFYLSIGRHYKRVKGM